MNFIFTIREIIKRKSLARALMHEEVKNHYIEGVVLDIGGINKPEYINYFSKGEIKYESIDLKSPEQRLRVNLETDKLPFDSNSVDYILMFNVLEHIFNYSNSINESSRVLKGDGAVFGFVPFLVRYHPDPNDYFRYTKDALSKIFEVSGFSKIKIKEIGGGPFAANYNNIVLSIPVICRIIIFPFLYLADLVFIKLRPNAKEKYPLGYFFELRK